MTGTVYTHMSVDESTSKMFITTDNTFQIVSIPEEEDGVFLSQQYRLPKDIDCLGYCAAENIFSYVHNREGKISVGFAYLGELDMIQEWSIYIY